MLVIARLQSQLGVTAQDPDSLQQLPHRRDCTSLDPA